MLDNPEASDNERNHAAWIEVVEKLACSTKLHEVTWNNSRLLQEDILSQIRMAKEQEGGGIVVLGSPRFDQFPLKEGLVDFLRLTVSPLVVGGGLRLLEEPQASLKLLDAEVMKSGVLGLTY